MKNTTPEYEIPAHEWVLRCEARLLLERSTHIIRARYLHKIEELLTDARKDGEVPTVETLIERGDEFFTSLNHRPKTRNK